MFTLTKEERDNITIVLDEIQALGHKEIAYKRVEFTFAITEFTIKFRPHGIQAMIDFIRWARANDEPKQRILSTLMHDINGRNDRMMDPRTSGYLNIDPKGE